MYPTEAALDEAAGKNKEEKYHVRWEGRCWDELKSRDQRKTVLRKAVMKSGRLNHANVRSLSLASGRLRREVTIRSPRR